MTGPGRPTPFEAGRDLYGPLVAEFCLRLWALSSQLDRPADAVLLWCARGGLRMQLAYERFLAAAALEPPVASQPLMVSRVAAARPAVARSLRAGDTLLPAVARTLQFEFGRSTTAATAEALGGTPVPGERWAQPYRAEELVALLRSADGQPVADRLHQQADLFVEHLRTQLDGAGHGVLVDTGLYGTTLDLVEEAVPGTRWSSVLLARSFRGRRADQNPRTIGLGVTAWEYSPVHARTALLRHWHFVEWLFEPDLPSVRTFHREGDAVGADLQVPGWQEAVPGPPGTAYDGVLTHLDGLADRPAGDVLVTADRAWRRLRRVLVRPTADEGRALAVGVRSDDFGRDRVWGPRQQPGVLAALRGPATWREGEIARSRSPWRLPALAAVEAAYAARSVKRRVRPRPEEDRS